MPLAPVNSDGADASDEEEEGETGKCRVFCRADADAKVPSPYSTFCLSGYASPTVQR